MMTAKPSLVPALRSTWRKSAEHVAEQFTRFLRLTVLAAIPSITNLISGGKFDWRTLLAFVLPFAEVAYRQVFPALGAAAVDSAPGAAIVPAEVAADPVDAGLTAVGVLLAVLVVILAFSLFGAFHSPLFLLLLILCLLVLL